MVSQREARAMLSVVIGVLGIMLLFSAFIQLNTTFTLLNPKFWVFAGAGILTIVVAYLLLGRSR